MELSPPCAPQFKMLYLMSENIAFGKHVVTSRVCNIVKRHPNFEKCRPLEAEDCRVYGDICLRAYKSFCGRLWPKNYQFRAKNGAFFCGVFSDG